MDDYTTPPHLAIRVLWRLRLGGKEVEARFYPTDQYLAVLIRVDGQTATIRRFPDQEVALWWADEVRGVYACFGDVLPEAERPGPGDGSRLEPCCRPKPLENNPSKLEERSDKKACKASPTPKCTAGDLALLSPVEIVA